MTNPDKMSMRIINIIDALLENEELVKFVGFDGNNPSLSSIDAKRIEPNGEDQRIFPYAFDVNYTDDVRSQINLYIPDNVYIQNQVVEEAYLVFDIVVHKKIWLLKDMDAKLIRPYYIKKIIEDIFKHKDVNGVGKIEFIRGENLNINKEFSCYRLICKLVEF